MEQKVDYIIVGQGLAGSTLAVQLLKKDKKLVVFDTPDENSSSSVAAGLFNPITGKNWVKTWKADLLFPHMKSFFKTLESKFNKPLIYDKPIYRPFSTLAEQNDWVARSSDPNYLDYVEEVFTEGIHENQVINPLGGLMLKNTGYLDIQVFLSCVKQWLQEASTFKQEYFDYGQLIHHDDKVVYQDYTAGKIIFCDGTHAAESILWKYLPFRGVKGELLTLKISSSLNMILNMGVFLLPIGEDIFRAGSTYNYNDIDTVPSEKGKNHIIEKLENFFLPKFDIIGHDVGIRPATLDRRPFLGMHADFKNYIIFNGLGAKGVTLAPYFSEILLNFLENKLQLEKEINIERYNR